MSWSGFRTGDRVSNSYGLIQALKAQDKDTTEIQERFDKVGAQADVTLTASRF
jgi:hypothetical protein